MKMEGRTQTADGKLRVCNRDVIKYVAMLAMLLNHIAHIFLTRGTLLYEILEDIGFFTAPVMCYFLVEGYGCTSSRVKYGCRLFLFAVLSQIPYQLAMDSAGLNMIFTLFCCFLILTVMERVGNPLLRAGLVMALALATVYADWALIAPIFTVCFYDGRGDRKKTALYFGLGYVLFAIMNVQNYRNGEPGNWTAYAVFHALLSGLGILAAGAVVLFFYNGRRIERGKNFSKWFFYLFYPVHLLALYGINVGMQYR